MALDIIFLSYDEPNADINFNLLKGRFPYVKRVHGVKGIATAHKAAADLAETRLFYVIDGDTEVFQSFDFTFKPPKWDQDYVHIWKARNTKDIQNIQDQATNKTGIKRVSRRLLH